MRIRTLWFVTLASLAWASTAFAAWADDPAFNLAVSTAAGNQNVSDILPDGNGGAWIVWSDTRKGSSNADIHAQHVLAIGVLDPAWPDTGLVICSAAGSQTVPVLASDGGAGFLVSWLDQRSGATNPDLFAHHVLATGALDPAWPVQGAVVCNAPSFQFNPSILADGASGAFVAWGDLRTGSNDIYVQRLAANGTASPGWPANGRSVCSASGDQFFPQMVSDDNGGVLLAWEDSRSGASDIYTAQVSSAGVLDPAWPVNGLALCTAAGAQENARIVSDGASGAIVAWTDSRNPGNADIYAQRVSSGGVVDPLWQANGNAVCSAGGDQSRARLVPSGPGSAIVMWSDRRGPDQDIYAQRLLGDGTADPVWTSGGVPLCEAIGDQLLFAAQPDGLGGALLVWQDSRGGGADRDVYAHHMLVSGTPDPLWPDNGRGVCTAPFDQLAPVMAAIGDGKVIVAWADRRDGTVDAYAQRVLASGLLSTVGVAPASPTSLVGLAPAMPNPARASTVLRFSLPAQARVVLRVVDLAGRQVRSMNLGTLAPGEREWRWDLTDEQGRPVTSGVYFAVLHVGASTALQRFAVLR